MSIDESALIDETETQSDTGDPEREAAIALMRSYVDRFDAIMELVHGRAIGEKAQKARTLLRELKDVLKNECKQLDRRRHEFNKYEYAFVEPALRGTIIDTRINTVPDERWHSELCGAQLRLSRLLFDLEHLPANWPQNRNRAEPNKNRLAK